MGYWKTVTTRKTCYLELVKVMMLSWCSLKNCIEEKNTKKDSTWVYTNASRISETNAKFRSLDHVLPWQLLIKAKSHGKRGEIPEAFTTSGSFTETFKVSARNQLKICRTA